MLRIIISRMNVPTYSKWEIGGISYFQNFLTVPRRNIVWQKSRRRMDRSADRYFRRS